MLTDAKPKLANVALRGTEVVKCGAGPTLRLSTVGTPCVNQGLARACHQGSGGHEEEAERSVNDRVPFANYILRGARPVMHKALTNLTKGMQKQGAASMERSLQAQDWVCCRYPIT
jgi:hypothetical protein